MNRNIVFTNFIWRFMERFGAQFVSFIISIILARLLDISDFGAVVLVTVIIDVLQVFVDSGFGNALIQKQNADDLDFSSVFYFNVFICIIIYIALYLFAPAISTFYEIDELTSLIRVLGLTMIFSGVKNVQQAYISRNFLFKKFFFATLVGTIGSAVIGVWMAYSGYGVWALVALNLFNITISTIVLWMTVKWRPQKMFSLERLKILFSYGWKLLAASLFTTIYANMRQVFIGKFYSAENLAYYNKGHEFPAKIVPLISTSVDNVLLPAMSSAQDSTTTVCLMTRRAARVISYLLWPCMIGLAVCSRSLVKILLTEKWLPCLPYLWVFCVEYAFWPISSVYNNSVKSLGRSDLILKIIVANRILGIVFLLISLNYGVFAIALSSLITTIFELIITSYINRKIFFYSVKEQLHDLLPPIVISFFMGVVVYAITFINLDDWQTLLIQIPLGIAIYIGLSILFHIDSFDYLYQIIKSLFVKGNFKNG